MHSLSQPNNLANLTSQNGTYEIHTLLYIYIDYDITEYDNKIVFIHIVHIIRLILKVDNGKSYIASVWDKSRYALRTNPTQFLRSINLAILLQLPYTQTNNLYFHGKLWKQCQHIAGYIFLIFLYVTNADIGNWRISVQISSETFSWSVFTSLTEFYISSMQYNHIQESS